jgi:hypothetical protein
MRYYQLIENRHNLVHPDGREYRWFKFGEDPAWDNAYSTIKFIGNKLNATHWTQSPRVGLPWTKSMIGGGSTFLLDTPKGFIALDPVKQKYKNDSGIMMSQISAEKTGNGLGTDAMNAVKDYADSLNMPLIIYKVTNRKFFDKIPWLERTDIDVYEYNPKITETKRLDEVAVLSSWIDELDYEDGDVIMTLLSGREYIIQDVDEDTFDEWIDANSKGKFWWSDITGLYRVRRVA